MQLYELSNPTLGIYVRYKILTPPEAEMLACERDSMPRDGYTRTVIEAVIYNLTEVTDILREMPKDEAKDVLMSLYNGAIMLNPALDMEVWILISSAKGLLNEPATQEPKKPRRKKPVPASRKISKAKYLNLERYLEERVIGQTDAVTEVVQALKRSLAGLGDENRPLGVFLFAGASGVGKTHLARELHKYLFGETEPVRIDCGEYQHKHETSKLIGAPPGYVGFEAGGAFSNAVKKNPHTVVLLDEVEKAHPDIWHTFLRVFDEGVLTDGQGDKVDFRNTIIIMTTNLGNRAVVNEVIDRKVGFGISAAGQLPPRAKIERLANEAIRKMFMPEFLNRIDKTVVFNHLTKDDLFKVAELELQAIDIKLAKRGFALRFDDDAVAAMVRACNADVQGARKLAQIRRDQIENRLADYLLGGRHPRGTIFSLTWDANTYQVSSHKPVTITA